MNLSKSDRNNLVLLMITQIKFTGTCAPLCVELIKSGVNPKLVSNMEEGARRFLEKYPNFNPLTGSL